MSDFRDEAEPEPRDDLIARALQRRSVPDHAPDFWDELHRAMVSGEAPRAGQQDRRRRPRLVGAAAMVVVVAGVGALLLSRGPDDTIDVAGPTLGASETTSAPLTGPTTEPPLPLDTAEVVLDTTPGSPTTTIDSVGAGRPVAPGSAVSTTLGPPAVLSPAYAGATFEADARLVVVGLAHGELLDVLVGPADGYGIVRRLSSSDVVRTTGVAVLDDASQVWLEITGESDGWVPGDRVAQEGRAEDVTDAVVAPLLDLAPPGSDRRAVIEAIGALRTGDEAAGFVVSFDDGDDPSVMIDVMIAEDDAVVGERLYVALVEGDPGTWTPLSVEAVPLCARGITPDGLCR